MRRSASSPTWKPSSWLMAAKPSTSANSRASGCEWRTARATSSCSRSWNARWVYRPVSGSRKLAPPSALSPALAGGRDAALARAAQLGRQLLVGQLEAMAVDELVDQRHQVLTAPRLGQDVVQLAGGERAGQVVGLWITGDDDPARGRAQLGDQAEQAGAVEAGHAQVGHHHRRRVLAHQGQGLGAVAGGQHLVAAPERALEQLEVERLIIDTNDDGPALPFSPRSRCGDQDVTSIEDNLDALRDLSRRPLAGHDGGGVGSVRTRRKAAQRIAGPPRRSTIHRRPASASSSDSGATTQRR